MGLPKTSHRVSQSPSNHQRSQLATTHLQLMPSHQVKNIPTFTGQEKTVSIDDWVRDARYLIDTTAIPAHLQFSTIVRYLGGSARKLILNLPKELQTPKDAFAELKAQFGDMMSEGDPLAEFYERVRRNNESASIYAVELEATLRTTEERLNRPIPQSNRNRMLTQQFMRGVKDEKITQRLAPMRPRDMPFRELQAELRLIERKNRLDAALNYKPTKAPIQSQSTKPPTQPSRPSSPSEQRVPEQPREQQFERPQKSEYKPEVIQDIILQMQHLTKQVDSFSRHHQPIRPVSSAQPQRVYVCYNCGQEGHIAR